MLVEEHDNCTVLCAAAKGSLPDTRGQVSGRSYIVPPLSFRPRLARLPSRDLAPETELTVDWWTGGGTDSTSKAGKDQGLGRGDRPASSEGRLML